MPRSDATENLSGDIPKDLRQELSEWIDRHRDVKIRQVVETMTELWLKLPLRLQGPLMISPRDSDGFDSVVKEIEQHILPFEDVFLLKEKHAGDVVRRLLLMLADYAGTGQGIGSTRDLQIFLEASCNLLYWLKLDQLEGASTRDRAAVNAILDALKVWRYGEQNVAEIRDAKAAAKKVVRGGASAARSKSHRQAKAGRRPEAG